MECEFCKNTFSSKSNLNFHQRNNKACLLIQQNNNIIEKIKIDLLPCEFCKKTFTSFNLKKHLLVCKKKKKIVLVEENEKINLIKNEIEKIKVDHEKEIKKIENKCENEMKYFLNKIRQLENYIIKLETENSIYKKNDNIITQKDCLSMNYDNKKKVSINPIDFFEKDVLYFYEFEPTESFKKENKYLLDENRRFYEFGVTSDLETREKSHRNDKSKIKVRLEKVVQISSRYKLSKVEKYTKNILNELNLLIRYKSKTECFIANDSEIKIIYDNVNKIGIDEKKNSISLSTTNEKNLYIQMFKNEEITFEQLLQLCN